MMMKLLMLCFLVGNIVVDVAMASDKTDEAMAVEYSNPAPTEAPSVVMIRKLGPPSMAPESEQKWRSERTNSDEEKKHSHEHSSFDKSIAGGGVILGGLATTFLVSVFCYIRATSRSQHNVSDSPSSSP